MSNTVTKQNVLDLLGGEYPEVRGYEGFCWESIDHWVVEDGMLHPADMSGNLVPGPSFEILKPVEVLY